MLRLEAELGFVFLVERDVKRRGFVDLDSDAMRIDEIATNRITPLMESED